ncbi:unnamed protein product [Urochloa humidicola]
MPSREKKGGATRRKGPAAPPRHPAQVTPAAAAPLHPAMVAPAATTQLPLPAMVAPAAAPPPPPMGFHAPPPSQMGHAASPGPLPPWGGYVNLLQQPQFSSIGENFHFVGHTRGFAPISPSPSPSAQRQPSSQGTDKAPIDVDGGDDGVETSRTTKRRHWSHEEEVRLASAWLNNSNDSIRGNDKKGDTFWKDIIAEFNSNAPADRQRDTNQLKIHWSRLKTVINDFNGCWTKATRVNKSGASDDQLMDEALKMFEVLYKKPFTLIHWWRTLKNQPKWCAYVAQLEKEKQQSQLPIHVDDDIGSVERPIGRDAAKAQRNGKRKAEEITEGLAILGDNINKMIAVMQERKQEREKVTGAHLEISRLKLKTADKEMRANMLVVYNSLIQQDTSQMTDESKARRAKHLEMMENTLFSNNDDV